MSSPLSDDLVPRASLQLSLAEAMLFHGLADRLGMSTPDAIRVALTALIEMSGSAGERPAEMPSIARLEAELSALKGVIAVTDASNRRGFELIYESVEAIRKDVRAIRHELQGSGTQ